MAEKRKIAVKKWHFGG